MDRFSCQSRWSLSGLVSIVLLLLTARAFALSGDLDATFGQHGRTLITSPTPGVYLQPNHFIQQSDGKIVVIGWTEQPIGTRQDFAVVRLNTDGSLDTSFDGDGIATIDFGPNDQGIGVVQQPADGKLVVVGFTLAGCSVAPCMAAARLNTNGSLDSSFGTGGKKIVTDAAITASVAVSAVMQGTNIVIGGQKNADDFIYLRLTSAGAVDPTFNAGAGATVIDMGMPILMTKMIGQVDGSFIAAGGANINSTTPSMGIARITNTGAVDTSFNSGTGKLMTPCIGPCQWLSVAQQPDGKLLFAGFDSLPGVGTPLLQQSESLLERRNLDGTLDATFGQGGRLMNIFAAADVRPASTGEVAWDLAVDAGGKIVVIGKLNTRNYASGAPTTSTLRMPVARYNASGTIDSTFGVGGLRLIPTYIGPITDVFGINWNRTGLLTDGRIITLGAAGATSGGNTLTNEGIVVGRLSNGAGDPGLITIVSGGPFMESSGTAWALVGRVGGSTGAISVSYAAVTGTATAGADFTPVSGTLNWADGESSSKFIKVPIVADAVVETSDEMIQIQLSNATGGAEITDAVMLTIVRDDIPPANTVSLSPVGVTVAESGSSVTFNVTRTGIGAISVNYTTAWDSDPGAIAQSPSDYVHTNGILIWSVGDTAPKTITIPIVNDSAVESSEVLNLGLFVPGGVIFGSSVATVTITDDDTAPPPSGGGNSGGGGGGGGGGGTLSSGLLLLLAALGILRLTARAVAA